MQPFTVSTATTFNLYGEHRKFSVYIINWQHLIGIDLYDIRYMTFVVMMTKHKSLHLHA